MIPVPIDSMVNADLVEQWHRENGMLAFALRGPDMIPIAIDVLVRPMTPFVDSKRDVVIV